MKYIKDNRSSNSLSFEKLILEAQDDGLINIDSDMDKVISQDNEKMYSIGNVYYKLGIYRQAMAWLSLSTKNEAQLLLGVMYEQGVGVPKDEITAFKFYYKNSFQGSSKASTNIRHLESQGHYPDKADLDLLTLEEVLLNIKKNESKINELEREVNELKKLLADKKSIVHEFREKKTSNLEQDNHISNNETEKDHLADKFEKLHVSKDIGLEQRLSKMESVLSNIYTIISKESHD